MTDFGRPAGAAAGPHKTTHQNGGTDEISIAGLSGQAADDQPVDAHALAGTKHSSATLAQLNAKVSDAALDDSGDPRTPSGHKVSHQDGGSDEISVAGLVGATPRAVLGDATAGRVFRATRLFLKNGTNPETIKCQLLDRWNGHTVAETNNIGKGQTVGDFTYSGNGLTLTIEQTAIPQNVLLVMAIIYYNSCGAEVSVDCYPVSGKINLNIYTTPAGVAGELQNFVDPGDLSILFTYITDA